MTGKKLNVALLAGGRSGEREVSLMGAAGVEKALDPEKFNVTKYDPLTDLSKIAADAPSIDFAFILLHGLWGEDGTMQGFLDLLDIPYQGSGVIGSALAMDKNLSKELYRLNGLPVAEWKVIGRGEEYSASVFAETLGFPIVVKPVADGSSLGMTIAKTLQELEEGIQKALDLSGRTMVEKFINGREITVGVLGNKNPEPLPVIEIIPGDKYEFFDYEAKYQPGATREICPAEIEPEITAKAQRYGVTAHKSLQLEGYSRTDMIISGDGEIYLLETNTIPGMTPTSLFPQAAEVYGLSFSQMLERLIELGMESA